jgi:hypothetical protein
MKFGQNTSGLLIKWCVQLIFVVFCISCLSPIEIRSNLIGGQVVISGQISTIDEQNFVQVGRTANTERLPFPYSGVSVYLFDDLGNSYFYVEDEYNPGTYLLHGISAIPGVSYHIQIVTPEGEIYESIPEKTPADPGSVSTGYEIVTEPYTDKDGVISTHPFVKIYADVTLPESSKSMYLKWTVDEVFLLTPTDFPDPFAHVPPPCFVAQNADPQTISLLSTDNFTQQSFNQMLIASRLVDWSFLERHYFTTYQSSITSEAYEYWTEVDILANSTGSIFDTPPAEIKGNIFNFNDPSEKVHGYFQAVNQTYDRFYLLPAAFPFPLLFDDCLYEPQGKNYQPRCLDCLTARNSSYRRPDWF